MHPGWFELDRMATAPITMIIETEITLVITKLTQIGTARVTLWKRRYRVVEVTTKTVGAKLRSKHFFEILI